MNNLEKMSIKIIAQGMWVKNLNLLVSNLKCKLGDKVMYATHVRGRWDELYIDNGEEEDKIIKLGILDVEEILKSKISVRYDSYTDENEFSSIEDYLYWVMFRRQQRATGRVEGRVDSRYDLAHECR